jgi:hypothetical protein
LVYHQDGAFVQAKTIATLIHIKEPQQLDVAQLLQTLLDACRTEELKKKLTAVMDSWQTIELDDYEAEEKFLATISEPFQIEAVRDFLLLLNYIRICLLWELTSEVF